jgi:hypothetical protein
MSGSGDDQKNTSLNIGLGNRNLELRRAPACQGSGYLGFFELYLDRKYEGYIGIPERGGTHVMIYGRSQVPESHVNHEVDEEPGEDNPKKMDSWIARILNHLPGG